MKSDPVQSDKKIMMVAIVVGLLLFGGVVVSLYMKDSQTVQEAIVVRAYVVNFCMEHARYLSKDEFDQRFPKLAANPDWFYWPGEYLKSGTFQYPMTLPVPSAPGNSKLSEFIPIIYSYAVSNPCQTFSRELL
jgi:type II secretory pathway pseudopilin PulG